MKTEKMSSIELIIIKDDDIVKDTIILFNTLYIVRKLALPFDFPRYWNTVICFGNTEYFHGNMEFNDKKLGI